MRVFTDAAILSAQDEVSSAWNRLALSTPQPDPFCATTHWQLSFREAIDPERPSILRQCDDGLIQFAQHTMSGDRKVLGPIERQWLFGCNLLGPAAHHLLEGILEELKTGNTTTPFPLVISGLDPSGSIIAALRFRLEERYSLMRFRAEVQCAASLSGGLDGFLARRSGNHRRNLRRYLKRAHGAGVLFERHRPASAKEAKVVFDRMLAVERVSWKGIGQCGMDQPRMLRFYWAMLSRLSRSRDARIIFATKEGRDVGYIFGGLAGAIYRGQQFSFDARYADMSIGNLMQFEQIRWLCEEGAQRYDLGPLQGASMSYKHHWTELHFPIEAWTIHHR